MCEMMRRSLNELNWIKIYVDNVSHISYLITQLTRFSITWLVRLLKAEKMGLSVWVEWNETSSKYIKWLPPVAGPDRPHSVQEDKQEEKHDGVSVSQSISFNPNIFYIRLRSMKGREQWQHLNLHSKLFYRGNQELYYLIGYLLYLFALVSTKNSFLDILYHLDQLEA